MHAAQQQLPISAAVARAGACVAALVVGVWATYNAYLEAASTNHRELAAGIENGTTGDWDYFTGFDRRQDIDRFLATCRSDLIRAAVTIRLAALDASLVTADAAIVDGAYDKARETVVALLGCAPGDGNGWLQLAMLDASRNGPSPEVIDALRTSHADAPGERWVVKPRVEFAARLVAAGVAEIEPDYRADVARLAAAAQPFDIANSYVRVSGRARSIFDDVLSSLPPHRAEQIGDVLAEAGLIATFAAGEQGAGQ